MGERGFRFKLEPRTPNPAAILALKEELVGGKVEAVKGEGESVTKVSYFRGNDQSKWKSGIATYEVVSLGEVYRGIELKLKAYGNNVEKLFYVKSGAEPEKIKVRLNGSKGLNVNKNGELEVETELGAVKFTKPVAFQEAEGKKEFVEVAYAVKGDEYGFSVGEYDRGKELVIDPILAATFLGGDGDDLASDITLDETGNVYVAGSGFSFDFPGSDNTLFEGNVFVAKLNPDLSSILSTAFLGGSVIDLVNALILDKMGNVYVTGDTDSPDFTGIDEGSADSTFSRGEAFIVKLNSSLSSILSATFLGGSENDFASDIILDGDKIYVAGVTTSSDFPGIGLGSADNTFARQEAFIANLDSSLSSITAATFLGGAGFDSAYAITRNSTGDVYVTGGAGSLNFPGVGSGSADRTFAVDEAFVAKLNSNLSSILSATFLGGSDNELAFDITLLMVWGDIYVIGITGSSNFPGISVESADNTFSDISPFFGEVFVAKLNSNLSSIVSATFLGGTEEEFASDIVLDGGGGIYVSGGTESQDFPGVGSGSADSTIRFGDAFIVRLNSNLRSVLSATFLGGEFSDINFFSNGIGAAIALDSSGNVYAAGRTFSSDFPGIDSESADDTFDDRGEAFIAKLDPDLSAGTLLPRCGGFVATIVGGGSNDFINGTSGRDVIDGLGGDDTINGLDGKDIICGGSGNDVIDGGRADDQIFGENGNDRINGSGGNDILRGEMGRDTISGGLGDDQMFGGSSNDTLRG